MNTLTRVYENTFSIKRRAVFRFTGKQLGIGLLVFGLLVSAFGVIYTKDLNRRLFITYQTMKKQEQFYQMEWSKLLLEEGAWSTQSRIQWLAQQKLHMQFPTVRKILVLSSAPRRATGYFIPSKM